jgi:hypothetical protein
MLPVKANILANILAVDAQLRCHVLSKMFRPAHRRVRTSLPHLEAVAINVCHDIVKWLPL